MFGKPKKESVTYGIIGLGRFGMALAMELAKSGAEFMVVDRDEEKVRELREFTENAFVVKNIDKKSLLATGVQNCDVAVICIGEQMDTSILATLNLVSAGVPLVISKANSAEHGEILEKLGAEVVYPERDMAIRLAHRIETSRVLDFVQLSEKINISKMLVPAHVVGKSILDINIRARFGLNIIAIENHGNVMEIVRPEYILQKDDILYLSGSREGMVELSAWIGK